MFVEKMPEADAKKLIALCDGRGVVISAHDNADVDAIVSSEIMRRYLEHKGIAAKVLRRTPADASSLEIIEQEGLVQTPDSAIIGELPSGAAVILCDWSRVPNAPSDMDVIAIFDHHPTSNGEHAQIRWNEPVSSTSRLLVQLIFGKLPLESEHDVEWDDADVAQIMKSAAYATFTDTNGLKSTRTDPDDDEWITSVIEDCDLDREHMAEVGMSLTDLTRPIEELISNGKKFYELPNGKRAFMSYIVVNGYDNSISRDLGEELITALRCRKAPDGAPLDYAWHMICDLGRDETHVLKARRRNNADVEYVHDAYDGNLSRATDVYPMLERENLG